MKPSIYISVGDVKRRHINLDQFPSAGPRPNITGMKNKFWGHDAYVVRSGVYAYHVDQLTYIECGGA